ncbi:MAG: hypothetical protein ACI4BH_09875 [Muribaculaceae bacterium]
MSKINISKFVKGSLPDSAGDRTLYYTENCSNYGQMKCEGYSDSEGKLSPEWSTLLATYNKSEDAYVFLHIQAQQWTFAGGARKYTYRGAFGVSRTDAGKVGNMSSLVLNLPRIGSLEKYSGKVDATCDIKSDKLDIPGDSVKNLASHIASAMCRGKHLYITLEEGELGAAKGDEIFNNKKLLILLAAIDMLPADMRRYATFSFLADGNYSSITEDLAVNVCLNGCETAMKANDEVLVWNKAVAAPAANAAQAVQNIFGLTQDDGKLYNLDEIFKFIASLSAIERKVVEGKYSEVDTMEWKLWLIAGNNIATVRVTTWDEYSRVKAALDAPTAAVFAKNVLSPAWFSRIKCSSKEELLKWETELDKYGMLQAVIAEVWKRYGLLGYSSLEHLVKFRMRHQKIRLEFFDSLDFSEVGDDVNIATDKQTGEWYKCKRDYYYTKRKPNSIRELSSLIYNAKGSLIGRIRALNEKDYSEIFSKASAKEVMCFYEDIDDDFSKTYKKDFANIKLAVANYAVRLFPLNDIAHWPDFCDQMSAFPEFTRLIADSYGKAKPKDLDAVCENVLKHLSTLSDADARSFLRKAKVIVKIVLKGMSHDNCRKEMQQHYRKAMMPDSRLCMQLAIAALAGFVLASSIAFGVAYRMGVIGKKTEVVTEAVEPATPITMICDNGAGKDSAIMITDSISASDYALIKSGKLKSLVYERDTVKIKAKDLEQFSDTTKKMTDSLKAAYHMVMYKVYVNAKDTTKVKPAKTGK